MHQLITFLVSLVLILAGAAGRVDASAAPAKEAFAASFEAAFEPNLGQMDDEVLFAARASGYALFLTAEEAVMVVERASADDEAAALDAGTRLQNRAAGIAALEPGFERPRRAAPAVTRLRWLGARAEPEVRGARLLASTSGYFKGADPGRWRARVPRFAAVEYPEIYPGIDLVFHFGDGELEYDFVVGPGADPEAIRLELDGPEALEIDGGGNLVLQMDGAEVTHLTPYVYQEIEGIRQQVAGAFAPRGEREIGFRLAAWDRERELVIDPKIEFSTYLGGSSNDGFASLALDADVNLYVATYTLSDDFPTKGSGSKFNGGDSDFAIAKFDRNGKFKRAIYLGGNEAEGLRPELAAHSTVQLTAAGGAGSPSTSSAPGALFLAGHSFSKNYPTTPNALDRSLDCSKAFKPIPGQVCVDDKCCPGDIVVTAFDLDLEEMLFSTFLGGNSVEGVGDMLLDDDGRIYLAGTTASKNFPKFKPTQAKRKGGVDAVVVILDPPIGGAAAKLQFSTFLGGKDKGRKKFGHGDYGQGIALDPSGFLHVGGETTSKKFPRVDPIQNKLAGASDVFLAVYDLAELTPASGARRSPNHAAANPSLVFSTYIGGKEFDSLDGLAVDDRGYTHLVGWTNSENFPTRREYQANLNGDFDAWVAVLDLDTGSIPTVANPEILFSTYFGGSNSDFFGSLALAVGRDGTIHFGGPTYSPDLPTEDPTQGSCAPERTGAFPPCQDSFYARFEQVVPGVSPRLLFSTFLGGPAVENDDGTTTSGVEFGIEDIVLDRTGSAYLVGQTFSKKFPIKRAAQKKKKGPSFDLFLVKISK